MNCSWSFSPAQAREEDPTTHQYAFMSDCQPAARRPGSTRDRRVSGADALQEPDNLRRVTARRSRRVCCSSPPVSLSRRRCSLKYAQFLVKGIESCELSAQNISACASIRSARSATSELARIIHEGADFSRHTKASAWYKAVATRAFSHTEAFDCATTPYHRLFFSQTSSTNPSSRRSISPTRVPTPARRC